MTCAHYVRETFRIYHLDAPPKPIMGILYDTKAPGYQMTESVVYVGTSQDFWQKISLLLCSAFRGKDMSLE